MCAWHLHNMSWLVASPSGVSLAPRHARFHCLVDVNVADADADADGDAEQMLWDTSQPN